MVSSLLCSRFVGYWGEQPSLKHLLVKTCTPTPQQWQFSEGENWQFACLSDDVCNLSNIRQLQRSASGLKNAIDAWVKIETDRLILGRESFGRTPLYWLQQEETIWFASHLQLLLLLPAIAPRIDLAGLYGYCCFSYIPTPLTPIENIFSLSAGRERIWQRSPFGSKEVKLYNWQGFSKLAIDEKEAAKQLQGLLEKAIAKQLEDLPSEPVGIFLSGGLDSSIVAALLVKAGVKVRAYTLDFGSLGISELAYAEQVARFLKTPLVKVAASPKQVKGALVKTVEALDLPFGDPVTVPLYLLSRAASQETAVIFNGEGGDQLFAGWTNKPLIAAGIYDRGTNFIDRYLRTFHRLYGYEEQLFQPQIYQQIQSLQPQIWLEEALDRNSCPDFLDCLRRATLMLKGAQNIHPRATNLASVHGLQVRSPFCDLPLAEWCFQLPGALFLQGSCEKYILKRAAESWLPPEIVWREKRGMGVPGTQWLLGELWGEMGSWLHPHTVRSQGIFQGDFPVGLILGQRGNSLRGRRMGEVLWLLLVWQIWRDRVLENSPQGNSLYNPFLIPYWGWKMFASVIANR
ncbi:asparagine synthetase B family protein [Spirulina sp. 06S082]|uniref:asparagine synthetase B family protein n=1 Tax=Spirulina sp. 06S082 TaxID=3110248 RepID=UPI002B1F00AA|nr:asparagine synthetase B family protein [Spirulina sp. 06S082]MEA5467712.1 asparagine synthetase B family protein [Spirulina sp. 06S082]